MRMWFPGLIKLTHNLVLRCNYGLQQIICPPSLSAGPTGSTWLLAHKAGNVFSPSYLRSVSALQPCGIIYSRGSLVVFALPQGITLVRYSEDTLPIGSWEREVTTTQHFLVQHLSDGGWERNLRRIQMPSASVTFLRVQCCGACQDTSWKEEGRLLHLALPEPERLFKRPRTPCWLLCDLGPRMTQQSQRCLPVTSGWGSCVEPLAGPSL